MRAGIGRSSQVGGRMWEAGRAAHGFILGLDSREEGRDVLFDLGN